MARTGDNLGYYYEEGYIDEGYIRYEPYIEDGYITDNYFLGEGAVEEASASLSVSFTSTSAVGVIRQGDVDISGAMTATFTVVASRNGEIAMATTLTMSTDAERTRSSDVVLATLINLSLQGDRLRDTAIAPVVAFTTTQTALRIKPLETALAVLFSPSITVVANRNGSTDLVTSTTLAATATRIKSLAVDPIATATTLRARPYDLDLDGSASLSSVFALASEPRKPTRSPTIVVQSFEDDGYPYDSLDIDNTTYKFGSGSAKFSYAYDVFWRNVKYGYLGSTLTGITNGYTLTSTDNGETWSQNSSSSLAIIPNYYQFTGSLILAKTGTNTVYYSTDGTSWSTQTGLPGTRELYKAGSYYYILSYSSSTNTWRIYRGTSLSNLAAQTTPWQTITNVNSSAVAQMYSDGTDLFYISYSSSTSSIKINNSSNISFANFGGSALVGGGKILLTSNNTVNDEISGTNWYGVYNSSGTGSRYQTPNNERCTPVYFDGTNIILENTTGQIYSGTLNNLTAKFDFETVDQFGFNWYFKPSTDYIRVSRGIASKSSDLNTWTDYLITAARDEIPYVKIDDGTKFSNDWGTIDFWINHSNISSQVSVLQNVDSQNGWNIGISSIVFFRDSVNLNTISSGAGTITANTWHHVRITRDASNNTAIYLDGTRKDTDTFTLNNNNNGLILFGELSSVTTRIDELFITTDVLSDPVNDTSYTVPTTPWTDPADGTTLLLMHFDNDFVDDAPQAFGAEMFAYINQTATANFTVDNNALLASQFSAVIDAIELESLDATTLDSSATLTADVGVIKQANSALSTIFSQTASYGRIRQGGTSLQSAFAQNATNTRTRDYDSALSVQASFASQATRIKQFEASFSAFYTQLSAVAKIGDFLVAYDTATVQTTTATVVRSGVAGLATAVTQTVDADAIKDANAAINTSTTLTATGLRIHPGAASVSSAATQTADVNAVRGGSASFAVTAQLDTDAAGGFVGLVLTGLLSNAGITATATRIQPGGATLSSAATQTASGDKIVGFSAGFSSAATLSATPGRIRPFEASFEAFNSQVTAVVRTAAAVADFDSQFTMVATGVVFAENETPLDVVTSMSVAASRTRATGATIDASATLTTAPIKAVEAGATLLSAGGFAMSALVTASGAVDYSIATTLGAAPTVIRAGVASATTTISMSVEPNQIKGFEAALNTSVTQTTNAGKRVEAEVLIDSAMTFAVISKVLHLAQYVYTIPQESRTFTIGSESRSYTINRETRTYTIEGE